MKFVILLFFINIISSCGGVYDKQIEDNISEAVLPDYKFDLKNIEEGRIPNNWLAVFEDEKLNKIAKEAFKDNLDIAQVRQRFLQAGFITKRTKSLFYPQIDAELSYNTQKNLTNSTDGFSLGSNISYQFDIFGKNSALYKSNLYIEQALNNEIDNALINLSVAIAENWVRLKILLNEEKLINEQIKINKMIFNLQKARFQNGTVNALSVLQQKQIVEQSEALLPDLHAAEKLIENQLLILSGKSPSGKLDEIDDKMPQIPPAPMRSLPVKLLENRADIQIAYLELLAAHENIKFAFKDRLPDINIGATIASIALNPDDLLNDWITSLIAEITAPLTDGGFRRNEQLRFEALKYEKFADYKQVVLNAILEVENASAKNKYQQDKIDALTGQLSTARNALKQAQISHAGGNSDYINVLNGLNNLQSLEREILNANLNLILYRIELYKSLGLRNNIIIDEDIGGEA